MFKRLCINCHDIYNDSKGKKLTGYCWYCREVIFGEPDDEWLRRLDIKELKNFHIEEIPEEEESQE